MDTLTLVAVFVYFLILGSLVLLLVAPLRYRYYHKLSTTNNNSVKKILGKYEENIHVLLIARQGFLFLLPLFVVLGIFGVEIAKEQLTSLFVLGLSINVFCAAYLSTLTKAKLYVDFGIDKLSDLTREITIEAESEHVIYFRLYNLGFTTLKNSSILVYFGEGFEILPCEFYKYVGLGYRKYFTVQKENGGAAFMPNHDNYQSIPPQEWFLFPLIVKAPKINVQRVAEIQVFSENSWGLTKIPVKVV
jgi:hypothetical protein